MTVLVYNNMAVTDATKRKLGEKIYPTI